MVRARRRSVEGVSGDRVLRSSRAVATQRGPDHPRPDVYGRGMPHQVFEAAVRETREEVGATLVDARLLGVLENLFRAGDGKHVHELCFVVTGHLVETGFGEPEWSDLVRDTGQPLAWLPEAVLRAGSVPFHPTAVLAFLEDQPKPPP